MTHELDTAKKIVEILDEGTSRLDDVTVAELAEARRQALKAMSQPAHVSHLQVAHAGMGRFLVEHLSGHRAWVPPVILLAIALMIFALMQHNAVKAPVEADALLLASELPPEAYIDKGFDAWLENSSQH